MNLFAWVGTIAISSLVSMALSAWVTVFVLHRISEKRNETDRLIELCKAWNYERADSHTTTYRTLRHAVSGIRETTAR